jgi:hypothetical protein
MVAVREYSPLDTFQNIPQPLVVDRAARTYRRRLGMGLPSYAASHLRSQGGADGDN